MQATPNDTRFWACPFYKLDPFKHFHCFKYRLSRLQDVMQHLDRYHCLDTSRCCPRCWREVEALDAHVQGCMKNLPNPGILDRDEFNAAKKALKGSKSNPVRKWEGMWASLFGAYELPDSPFIEASMAEHSNALCRKNREAVLEVLASQLRGYLVDIRIEIVSSIADEVLRAAYDTSPDSEPAGSLIFASGEPFSDLYLTNQTAHQPICFQNLTGSWQGSIATTVTSDNGVFTGHGIKSFVSSHESPPFRTTANTRNSFSVVNDNDQLGFNSELAPQTPMLTLTSTEFNGGDAVASTAYAFSTPENGFIPSNMF